MIRLKKAAVLIAMMMLMTVGTAGATANQEQVNVYDQQKNLVKSVVFMLGHDYYYVNTQTPGVKMDAVPFTKDNRTFVPIRYLSNALGVTDEHIAWVSPKVTLDEPDFPVVELAVGSKQLKSDGKITNMDVTPLAQTGRTYLPARWVAEALGYQVDWDAQNSVVICYPQGSEKPDVSEVIKHIAKVNPQPVKPPVQVEPQPKPVQPSPAKPGMPQGDFRDFKDLGGKPLNPNDYAAYDGWAIPYEFKQPGASRVDMTVEELRKQPVLMGNSGYMIIYDVDVQKDKLSVKQATGNLTPAPLILAKGKDVSVQRSYGVLVEHSSNPFTQNYTMSLDADPGGSTKIEDVTHIMILCVNQVLAIENPLYKGGK